MSHCIAYELVDHIDDSHDPPNQVPTDPSWQHLDLVVKLWLYGSISQSLITSAYSTKASARKVWLNLYALFHDNQELTTMQLENELHTITFGDLSIHDYCTKVKKLADLLEGLGEKVKDNHLVIHALNGLPSKFDSIAGVLRWSKSFPTFYEMQSALTVEESCVASPRVVTPSHDNHSSAPTLLHVGNTSRGSGNNYRGGGNRRGRTNSRGGGNNSCQNQPQKSSGNQRYGYVFFPPPTSPNSSQ